MKYKNVIIVIPARGNSKEIVNKNLRIIKKKPLLFHSIDFALKLKVKKILVSSESTKIMNLLEKRYSKNKNIVIDKRPDKLARDEVHTTQIVMYIIKKYKIKSNEYMILLQPTSPFRNLKQIIKNINVFLKSKFDSLISLSKTKFYDNNIRFISGNKIIAKTISLKQRRSSTPVYYVNGTFFMSKVRSLLKYKNFHNKNNSTFFLADNKYSIDINSNQDLKIARHTK